MSEGKKLINVNFQMLRLKIKHMCVVSGLTEMEQLQCLMSVYAWIDEEIKPEH